MQRKATVRRRVNRKRVNRRAPVRLRNALGKRWENHLNWSMKNLGAESLSEPTTEDVSRVVAETTVKIPAKAELKRLHQVAVWAFRQATGRNPRRRNAKQTVAELYRLARVQAVMRANHTRHPDVEWKHFYQVWGLGRYGEPVRKAVYQEFRQAWDRAAGGHLYDAMMANPAVSGAQYRLAQAVLSGASHQMPVHVAREIVEQTPAHLRSEWARPNPHGPVKPETTVRGIMLDALELHQVQLGSPTKHEEWIYRDGAGGAVLLKGPTNLQREPWVTYYGSLGAWQATVRPSGFGISGKPKPIQEESPSVWRLKKILGEESQSNPGSPPSSRDGLFSYRGYHLEGYGHHWFVYRDGEPVHEAPSLSTAKAWVDRMPENQMPLPNPIPWAELGSSVVSGIGSGIGFGVAGLAALPVIKRVVRTVRKGNPMSANPARLQGREEWLDYDGRQVVVDGKAYRIHASTHHQRYPYEQWNISVFAEPLNKRSEEYLATKHELGDDWDVDVLESENFYVQALSQLRGAENPHFHGRLGTGQRFQECVETMSKRPGIYDPAGLCASIERRKYGAKGAVRLEQHRRNPPQQATVAWFLEILSGALTNWDRQISAREAKRGRVNIYRLGHFMGALGRVRDDVSGILDRSDAEAMRELKHSINEHFIASESPAIRKVLSQIDAWTSSSNVPRYGNPGNEEWYYYWLLDRGTQRQASGRLSMGSQKLTADEALRTAEQIAKRDDAIVAYQYIGGPVRYAGMVRRNPEPEAESLYETFHGTPSTEEVTVVSEVHEHENLASLGRLVELKVKTLSGYELTQQWTGEGEDVPYLASSEDGRQLFIEGGDQSLNLKKIHMDGAKWLRDNMVIGHIHVLTYRTAKEHIDGGRIVDYFHKLSEESHLPRPLLLYDPRSRLMSIAGGSYEVKRPGIID